MLLYILGLALLCYLIFVFTSDHLNPFADVKAPLVQRRFRLGRAMAMSSLAAGAVAIALFDARLLNFHVAIGLYVFLTLAVSIPAVVQYKKSATWQ